MKHLITLLFLIALPLVSIAQNDSEVVNTNATRQVNTSVEVTNVVKMKPAVIKSAHQIKAIRLNHNKSFELISIKAFRKSLQIKTKTIKNC